MADPNNVKSIFLSASEKPPAERAAFLEQAVGGDTALRVRVEALLKAHDNPGSLLKEAAAEFGATIDLSPAEPSLAERPGTLIGPYKLLEQIGEGGMGVVYMADQQAPVRRRVALKVIKTGMDTRQVIARFEAERQALALMDHSNIARVLDAGATVTGRPYFVMELVKGVPVTEYCDEHNLSIPKRLELFSQVCQAVQHAHQKGLIHRDIKPSNVLVSTQDDRPVAKVIDFGVSKAMQGQLTEKTLFTEFQHLVGTPAYMSPEQAGGSLDIDTRSDVYSLGVLLYELLAGTPPFDPKELRSKTLAEMQRIIREVEPPTPSTRLKALDDTLATVAAQRSVEPRKLVAMVHGELDWIVMKALEKDRTRRYETPGGVARDIERYLRDEPVLACPPSITYRLKKFVRRNKIAAAFVLLLAAAVAALAISNVQTRRNERRAITETAKAKAVSDLLQGMLGSANPDAVKGAEYSVRQLLDDSSAGLGSELAGQPEVEAEIRATIGRAYWRLGVADKAESHLKRALQLRRQVFGPDHEKVADSLVDYAWNLAEQSRHKEAEANIRDALRIYRTRGTAAAVIQAQWGLQRFLISLKRFEEAEVVAKEALALARDSGGDYPVVANILHSLAAAQTEQGHNAEAEQTARQSVELHRRLHGPKHPETAWGLRTLGQALLLQRKLPEAETTLREALAIFRESYNNDHKSVKFTLGDIKSVLEAKGDRAGVEALSRVEVESATTSTDYAILDTLLKRARTQANRSEWKELDASIDMLDAFGKAALPESNYKLADGCYQLAQVLRQNQQSERAVRFHRHAIFLREPLDDAPQSARLAQSFDHNEMAQNLLSQKRLPEAEQAVRAGLELKLKLVAEFPKDFNYRMHVTYSYTGLATILHASERKSDAANVLDEEDGLLNELAADASAAPASRNWLGTRLRDLGDFWVRLSHDQNAEQDFQRSLDVFRKLGSEFPENSSYRCEQAFSHQKLASVMERGGQITEAERQWQRGFDVLDEASALIKDNDKPQRNQMAAAYSAVYDSALKQGKIVILETAARKWIALQPQNSDAHLWLGIALSNLGKQELAITALHKAIELRPDNFWNYRSLSLAFRRDGKYEEAAAACRKAIELEPGRSELYGRLGSILIEQGKADGAHAAFRKAMELGPVDAASLNQLSWDLVTAPDPKLRDPVLAVEMAKKAAELGPQDGDIWNTLGVAQYRSGDWQAAIEALAKSMDLRNGGDAADWFILAMAHWQLNHKDEARKQYEKSVEWMDKNQPKNEELLRFRAEAAELLGISEPATVADAATKP